MILGKHLLSGRGQERRQWGGGGCSSLPKVPGGQDEDKDEDGSFKVHLKLSASLQFFSGSFSDFSFSAAHP